MGVDPAPEALEIAPLAHHCNGGVAISENAETTLRNLYAAEEVASGPHRADRPGGDSLADCQVFGARAGSHAANKARQVKQQSRRVKHAAEKSLTGFASSFSKAKATKLELEKLRNTVRNAMMQGCGVVRTAQRLLGTISTLEEVQGKLKALTPHVVPENSARVLELRNMVCTGMMVTMAAVKREESRGSHYRADYPHTSSSCLQKLYISKGFEGMQFVCRMPYDVAPISWTC